ncbi:MAG: FGGY-family carbohydrate kinase [Deltaproteobacteria bacterium]|nr:FGGY-family carbohydrate kinase [Deltaproteobacteria bacterium]
MGDLILAHDLGTTGNKASLYDLSGRLVGSCYHPYETFYPRPGWVEQDPEDWWKAFVDSTRQVIDSAKVEPSRILGLCFSGHMMAGIPVDREGRVLQKRVFLWADHRSQDQAERIKQTVGWENFYHRTGGGMEIALYPIAKILWLKENQPEIYRRAYRFLGTKDVLVQRLTGRFVTDFSDASNTGLLDLRQRVWAKDLLAEVGIDETKLPDEILPSDTPVGTVKEEVSQATGLKPGTPVILGGGDVACAALGAGVIEEGCVYNYIGSASWLALASSFPVFDDRMRPFTLCHIIPNMYVVQLATFSAGVVYAWIRDQICWLESAAAQRLGQSAFDWMNQEASSSTPGANGLIFLPNLRPGGAPHNDLKARGALLGLTLAHKREDIFRAALEGITFNIRLLCEALEKQAGRSFPEIRMIGGGSKSSLWQEIEANVLNKRIATLSTQQEANSLGAAITAGVALGVFESFQKAAQEFIEIRKVTKPREEIRRVYDRQFELFNKAYGSLVPVNDALAEMARDDSP